MPRASGIFSTEGLSWSYEGKVLPGKWRTPTPEYVQISPDDVPGSDAYGVPLGWSIDAAQPSVSSTATSPGNTSPLSWSSTSPIDPMARLTDTSSLASLQDWLIVAAVGMGIGGSMLASLAFEMLAPRHTVAAASGVQGSSGSPIADPARSRDRHVAGSRRLGHRTVVIIAAIAIGLARQRQARQQRR